MPDVASPSWGTDPQLLLAGGQLVSAPLTNALNALPSFETGAYDPQRSLRENALNPAGIERAISMLQPGAIRAWHGTPHLFEAEAGAPLGRFREEAIGSGEGAQAYGWGHYVAGNPKVAEEYQRGLAGVRPVPADEAGNPLGYLETAKKFYEPGTIVPGYGGNFDRVLKFNEGEDKFGGDWSVDVQAVVPNWGSKFKNLGEALRDPEAWTSSKTDFRPRNHFTQPSEKELEYVGAVRGWQMTKPGALMEVHVLPEEHELLDWDKPLAKQPQHHQSLQKAYLKPEQTLKDLPDMANWTGEDYYRNLQRSYGGYDYPSTREEAASKALHEAGIPGIKYLDAGSRSAGKGTSNYVIFDSSNLRIVGRNGQRLEPVDYDPFAVETK